MTNCEVCDRELIKGRFEEDLGICPDCIMIECRVDSYKAFFSVIALILSGLLLVVALLGILFIVVSLFVNSGSYLTYLIPPLIVCLIIGPGLSYLIIHKSS